MQAQTDINTLFKRVTSALSATTTAPTKGLPIVDLMAYMLMGPFLHLYWQFQEAVTPSAGNFTADKDTGIFSLSTHGFWTGLKVRVSNVGGALPGELATATDYFVIKVNANTFKLAASLTLANAGTAMSLTTNGTGTNTVTPTSTAGSAGSGVYLLTLPDSLVIDSQFVNINTGKHDNLVGKCAVLDAASPTPVDVEGRVTAYDSTHLAMVANGDFVGSSNLGINSADKPVIYSLQAIVPVTGRNYIW